MNRHTRRRKRRQQQRKRTYSIIALCCILVSVVAVLTVSNLIGTAVGGIKASEPTPTPDMATASPTPAVPSAPPAEEPVETQSTPEPEPEPDPIPTPTLTESNFSNTVFIGDSMAEGFYLYSGIQGATFYYERGLRIEDIATDVVADTPSGKTTILNALGQKQYGRVVLILGLNELGWDNADVFAQRYSNLIDTLREIQPNAEIYMQAILPVTEERSSTDRVFNNYDIQQYNGKIAQVAEEKGVHYLDVSSVMTDSTGALLADASVDGIHLKQKYCVEWYKYISENL